MSDSDEISLSNWVQIRATVCLFDPAAEIYLFGPGTETPGKQVDLYIKSRVIDSEIREQIKSRLKNQQYIHRIDMVCEVKDENLLANLSRIGLNI